LHLDRERRSGGVTEERAGGLGFGLGRHFCIGYMLARAEIVTITELLLKTFDHMSISKKNVDNIEMDWWVWSAKELIVDI
jgi:cytochrome P450